MSNRAYNPPKVVMRFKEVRRLPENARCVTNAVLTRGSRIKQGWKSGANLYFETYHYPGALNFQSIQQVTGCKPDWAR